MDRRGRRPKQSIVMKVIYNKLVRDRIPEIIAGKGKDFATAVYDELAYHQALRQKVIEEAAEVAEVETQADLIREISDLYEVLDALLAAHDITKEDVLAMQETQRKNRGGFEHKLELLWVEDG